MDVLLTNDDGIDSPGLRALYARLSELGEVTVVAPRDDQSAVGRAVSTTEVTVHEHDLGYVLDGTPSDCVIAGVESLCPRPDVVVAGVNTGANIGMYTLGRSGTVSAAVEAAFFGIPAIAASLYLPGERYGEDTDRADYREAVRATGYLVENAPEAGVFEQADYLNLNAPLPEGDPAAMEITRPSRAYDMTAEHENGTVTLTDRMWERMASGDLPDPSGTDRRTVVEGRVSVSPLTAPHTTEHHESLDGLAAAYT
jgi:5'-nucleotidase